MILDRESFKRLRVAEERQALSALSPTESFAIGQALWASELAVTLETPPEPRGQNAARRLRIPEQRLAAAWAAFRM